MNIQDLKREASCLHRTLSHHRRRLHAFAECGFDLSKTIKYVKNSLRFMGYKPLDCGRAGVICTLPSPTPSAETVLLRADMDALPIRERTRLSFRAENGNAHACGHDMHASMLLGAAALLRAHRRELTRSVRFFFQGAEEILCGARDGVQNGVLDGVTEAFMIHVATALPYQTGTVLLPRAGEGAPAATVFEVEAFGKSAHAGTKSEGADALSFAAEMLCEASAFAQREGELLFSVGRLEGGDAPNVVAERARMKGTFRSYDGEKMKKMEDFLLRLAVGAKERCGVSATVRFTGACPVLQNDGALLYRCTRLLDEMEIPSVHPNMRSFASEDFAVIAAHVPALSVALCAGERERGYEHPLHHPSTLFDEDALPMGAALYAATALQTFTNGGTA